MSKVALVTLDDMPPLSLGEFQLSDDFETLFAGVGDVAEAGTGGSTPSGKPSVPGGTSPSQITSGVFKRLNVYKYGVSASARPSSLGANVIRLIETKNVIIETAPQSASLDLTREV